MTRVLYPYLMALDTIYSRSFAFGFLLLIASCRGWGRLPSDSEEVMRSTHDGQQSVSLAHCPVFQVCGTKPRPLDHALNYWMVWS